MFIFNPRIANTNLLTYLLIHHGSVNFWRSVRRAAAVGFVLSSLGVGQLALLSSSLELNASLQVDTFALLLLGEMLLVVVFLCIRCRWRS